MSEEKILKTRPISKIEFNGVSYTRTKYEDYKRKLTFEPLSEDGELNIDNPIQSIVLTFADGKIATEEFDPQEEGAKILAKRKNKSFHAVKSE